MFNVRLAGGHLYGKQLFTWLSLAVSLMASFVLSFFPLDVLDEIWDLIESVSEGFLTYSFIKLASVFYEQHDFRHNLTLHMTVTLTLGVRTLIFCVTHLLIMFCLSVKFR